MEAKTLTPDAADAEADAAAAAAGTLAAGELVWAKPSKPRRHCWWPARMLAACPASGPATRAAEVRYFGGGPAAAAAAPGAPPLAPPAQVRRFADTEADAMARGSIARGFIAAVEETHARAVAAMRAQLTCGCVPPAPSMGEEEGGVTVVVGVANLAPAEFLAKLREAALGTCADPVGLVDRARLKSWACAFGEGWGPDGARHYPRRPLEDLVDKIDLDVPAGDDRDADDWLAEDERMPLKRPQETPVWKKRSVTAVMEDLDTGEDEDMSDSPGPVTSGKRERKKSKYLSPPYTNLGVVTLPRKPVDSPRTSVRKAAEEDGNKVSPFPDSNSIIVEDVLLLVQGLGMNLHHVGIFPEAAGEFLRKFRSSKFVEGDDYSSYMAHECPGVHTLRNARLDNTPGGVSDSHSVLEQDKRVPKRGRKKDGDGSGGSSIKRKKREKISPADTLGSGLPITPAIPIRQMKAEDIRTLMKAGSSARGIAQDDQSKPSLFKCPVSATVPGEAKPGHEQVQENDKSVLEKAQAVGGMLPEEAAKDNDEAKLEATKLEMNAQNVIVGVPVRSVQAETMESEANIHIDVNAQSVGADIPVGRVLKEATEPEACVHMDKNVQGDVAVVPERSVSKEATELEVDASIDENVQSVPKEATKSEANIHIVENLQGAVANVPISSGPSPMHKDMAQPIDENKEPGSVEVCTVQQSYASLQALVPEVLKKENNNGTDIIAMNHTLKDECPKDEAPVQKVKLPTGAASNHVVVNGTCPDPANPTPNKKKRIAQHFENPAAILVEFTPGVIVPSREELLSAFGKYGYLIECKTEIVKAALSARVVFGKSTEAEKAYGDRDRLGEFGDPFATLSLQYLPPITLSVPSPSPLPSPSPSVASKPPLTDIRKNLEKMIADRQSALNKATSSDGPNHAPDKLLGDMQGLLAKVNKMLRKPSANTAP
ncbi:unnamed protein product [Urochloa decumbens]|uniref:PWWP domain-containing protein n=1 Tax=Urochloa decumbens TaxID=240449 RepID=A0ABC8Z8T1_9POAL